MVVHHWILSPLRYFMWAYHNRRNAVGQLLADTRKPDCRLTKNVAKGLGQFFVIQGRV